MGGEWEGRDNMYMDIRLKVEYFKERDEGRRNVVVVW